MSVSIAQYYKKPALMLCELIQSWLDHDFSVVCFRGNVVACVYGYLALHDQLIGPIGVRAIRVCDFGTERVVALRSMLLRRMPVGLAMVLNQSGEFCIRRFDVALLSCYRRQRGRI